MFWKVRAILILIGIALLSCATQNSFSPVTDLTKKYQFKGFSVLPPQGRDWLLGGQGQEGIVFYKYDASRYKRIDDAKKHTFGAFAKIYNSGGVKIDTAEDFQRANEHKFYNTLSEGRFHLIESKLEHYTDYGTDCTKYDFVQEESDNPIAQGEVFIITVHGFVCRHPYSVDRIVDAWYSERFIKGQMSFVDEALKEEAEGFLRSVEFTRLRLE